LGIFFPEPVKNCGQIRFEVNAAFHQRIEIFSLCLQSAVQEMLEDAICHISQRFGIDFSHEYQSDVDEKKGSVLILWQDIVSNHTERM
jgi:hypothetical protein